MATPGGEELPDLADLFSNLGTGPQYARLLKAREDLIELGSRRLAELSEGAPAAAENEGILLTLEKEIDRQRLALYREISQAGIGHRPMYTPRTYVKEANTLHKWLTYLGGSFPPRDMFIDFERSDFGTPGYEAELVGAYSKRLNRLDAPFTIEELARRRAIPRIPMGHPLRPSSRIKPGDAKEAAKKAFEEGVKGFNPNKLDIPAAVDEIFSQISFSHGISAHDLPLLAKQLGEETFKAMFLRIAPIAFEKQIGRLLGNLGANVIHQISENFARDMAPGMYREVVRQLDFGEAKGGGGDGNWDVGDDVFGVGEGEANIDLGVGVIDGGQGGFIDPRLLAGRTPGGPGPAGPAPGGGGWFDPRLMAGRTPGGPGNGPLPPPMASIIGGLMAAIAMSQRGKKFAAAVYVMLNALGPEVLRSVKEYFLGESNKKKEENELSNLALSLLKHQAPPKEEVDRIIDKLTSEAALTGDFVVSPGDYITLLRSGKLNDIIARLEARGRFTESDVISAFANSFNNFQEGEKGYVSYWEPAGNMVTGYLSSYLGAYTEEDKKQLFIKGYNRAVHGIFSKFYDRAVKETAAQMGFQEADLRENIASGYSTLRRFFPGLERNDTIASLVWETANDWRNRESKGLKQRAWEALVGEEGPPGDKITGGAPEFQSWSSYVAEQLGVPATLMKEFDYLMPSSFTVKQFLDNIQNGLSGTQPPSTPLPAPGPAPASAPIFSSIFGSTTAPTPSPTGRITNPLKPSVSHGGVAGYSANPYTTPTKPPPAPSVGTEGQRMAPQLGINTGGGAAGGGGGALPPSAKRRRINPRARIREPDITTI